MVPFIALGTERMFWNRTLDGLAVLGAAGLFCVYRLLQPIGALAVVADPFHVKPLLPYLESSDRHAEEVERDAERFFRAVDRAVLEHHSQPSISPLILASLPEHHDVFHRLSHNPFLVADCVAVHPHATSLDDLRERVWQSVEPTYLARLAEFVDEFNRSKSHGLGSDDATEIAKAVVAGRVSQLLVEADRVVSGRIDHATSVLTMSDLDDPTVDDALDDLAMLALQRGGDVVIVPSEWMPTNTGIAATHHY